MSRFFTLGQHLQALLCRMLSPIRIVRISQGRFDEFAMRFNSLLGGFWIVVDNGLQNVAMLGNNIADHCFFRLTWKPLIKNGNHLLQNAPKGVEQNNVMRRRHQGDMKLGVMPDDFIAIIVLKGLAERVMDACQNFLVGVGRPLCCVPGGNEIDLLTKLDIVCNRPVIGAE